MSQTTAPATPCAKNGGFRVESCKVWGFKVSVPDLVGQGLVVRIQA